MAESKKHIIEFGDESKKLISILEQQLTLFKSIGDAITKSYSKLPSEVITQLQQLNDAEIKAEKLKQESLKTQKLVDDANKRALKILQDKDAQERKTLKLHTDFQNAMTRQQKAQERLNKVNTDAQRPYIQLQARWQQAQKTLADLIVSQGQNAEATKKQRKEFEALDKQIKTVDAITKNYSKNVGNYASAIGGSIGKLAGAFGLVGGLTMGVNILKDAFSIMKEFDSEMVNLGAIAGKTRDQLGSLEKVIRDTAKSSLNTANEVAKVATELIKLGSSIAETEKLIPVVNNLSIALRSSADETAELLKSTLNAFGDGAEEAERYGDVIAGMANKTALDFGRIRDAMSYIAPVAKALGYTIEDTGALIGVLVDNGIKAESAGRLLRTAMIKLQGQGLTLNQALEKINSSSDKTTTAYKLMGAEASTLGVVLAANTEKLAKLSSELSNTQGALQELTDKQLKSLSAQIKITSSVWEEFILSIENGEGELAKFATSFLSFVNQAINGLTRLSLSWDELWDRAYSDGQKIGTEQAEKFLSQTKETEKRLEAMQKVSEEIKTMQTDIADLREKERKITEGSFFNKLTSKGVRFYQKDIEEKENYLGQLKGFMSRLQEENSKEALFFAGFSSEGTDATAGVDKKELTDSEIKKLKQLEQERLATIFATNKLELEHEIENNKNIALINAKNKEEQLAVQIAYNAEKVKLLDLEYAEEVRLAENNSEKLLLAKSKYTISTKKLEADTERINKEVQEKQYQDALKLANMLEDNDAKNAMKSQLMLAKTEQDKIDVRLKYLQKQRDIIDRNELQEIESGKHTANELLIILEEYNQKRVELNQEANEIIAEQAKKAEENVKNYLSKFNDMGNFGFSSLNVFTTIEENGKTMFENLLSDAKDWQSKMAVIVGAVGEVFKDVMGAMQQASNARFENELAQLQQSYEVNLMFAGDSAEAKERLEEELAEKQKEIRKKQAESDKKYAIMNSIITTAQGVTSMLATVPWPLNFVMAGIVGAMGLAQTAMIAATPIPEFWTGTDNAPEGLAWTQEKGAEVITDKKGNVKTMGHNKGATLTWLESGDKVYKNRQEYFNNELNGILGSNGISNHIEVNSEFDYDRFESIANKNKQQTFVNFDEDGFNVRTASRNNRQNLKNKYARR